MQFQSPEAGASGDFVYPSDQFDAKINSQKKSKNLNKQQTIAINGFFRWPNIEMYKFFYKFTKIARFLMDNCWTLYDKLDV